MGVPDFSRRITSIAIVAGSSQSALPAALATFSYPVDGIHRHPGTDGFDRRGRLSQLLGLGGAQRRNSDLAAFARISASSNNIFPHPARLAAIF